MQFDTPKLSVFCAVLGGVSVGSVALGASDLRAQRTLIVDASGAGQYRSISAALGVAKAGDRLLVRKGTYDPFTVDKGVTIQGEVGATVVIRAQTPVRVASIPRGQRCAISTLVIRRADTSFPSPPGALRVEDCLGSVQPEDLEILRSALSRVTPVVASLYVMKSQDVAMSRMRLRPGLHAWLSTISVVDSTLEGTSFPHVRGACSLTSSRADIARCRLQSGVGSHYAFAGLSLRDSQAILRGDARHRIEGGRFYENRLPAVMGYGRSTVTIDPRIRLVGSLSNLSQVTRRELPSLSVATSSVGGQSAIEVGAGAGELIATFFSLPSAPIAIPSVGRLWLGVQPFVLLNAGVCDARGRHAFTLQHGRDAKLRGLALG